MKTVCAVGCLLLAFAQFTLASDGVILQSSRYGVAETADRLEAVLQAKGMTVFARVPHSDAAHDVGIALRDTELLIFGNPKVGSRLMECQQLAALDLPMKALVWEDQHAQVWIAYNDPQYLKQRHQLQGCDVVLDKVAQALAAMTAAAGQGE